MNYNPATNQVETYRQPKSHLIDEKSFFKPSRGGVVLHSRLNRSTGFLSGNDATEFLASVANKSEKQISQIIEQYF